MKKWWWSPWRVVHKQTTSTTRKKEKKNKKKNASRTPRTWFLPLRTRTLVTRPNGMPRWTISASVTSLGMLRMWTTLDGLAGLLGSSLTCHRITTHEEGKKKTTKVVDNINLQSVPHGIQSSHFLVHRGNNKKQTNSTTLPPLNNLPFLHTQVPRALRSITISFPFGKQKEKKKVRASGKKLVKNKKKKKE